MAFSPARPLSPRVGKNAFCSFERDTFFAFRSFPSQDVATGTLQPELIHFVDSDQQKWPLSFCLKAIHIDAAPTADSPLAPFRDDLVAALHADGRLQDPQSFLHRLEGAALHRWDAVDEILLISEDGIAADAL
ncbi:hypothetical protein HFO10_20800, partial [Rhizobium laguerreae]